MLDTAAAVQHIKLNRHRHMAGPRFYRILGQQLI